VRHFFLLAAPSPLHFVYDIYLTTLLITWVFSHTRSSVFGAVLIHFMANFSEEIVTSSRAGDIAASVLTTIVVLGIIAAGGLAKKKEALRQ
jgi:hypothetical protein